MKKTLLLTFLAAICALPSVSQSTGETGSKYVDLYTSMKFDQLGEYYTEQTIFDDATMSFFGQGRDYANKKGKEDIVPFLKQGFSKVSGIVYEIDKTYSVGVIHFTSGTLKYTYSPMIEGEIFPMKMELPLTIVVEVKDGKVIRHQDIANYNEWYKQYQSYLKG